MPISIQEFWQLVVASGLHDEESCRKLANAFGAARDEGKVGKEVSLPDWMIAAGELTRYQAKVLLAGRAGPFVYGDYLVRDRLETAGVAGMFRAIHRPTKIPVCLQFLSGAALADPAIVVTLRQFAATAARISRDTAYLSHCHALVDIGDYKFFVVDELPYGTLAARISQGTPIPQKEAVRITWAVASGLALLHAAGEAHGAVRPERIWTARPSSKNAAEVRLAAFPLALDPLSQLTVAPAVVDQAALGYAPPEHRSAARPTSRGDIYSLGCTLYEMLSGQPPFGAGDAAAVTAIGDLPPRPLREINQAIAQPLVALVERMMAPRPEERFADAGKLVAAIEPMARHCGATIEPPAAPPDRAKLDAWLAEQGGGVAATAHSAEAQAPVLISPLDDAAPLAASSARGNRVAVRKAKHLPLVAGGAVAVVAVVVAAVLLWMPSREGAPSPVDAGASASSDAGNRSAAGDSASAPAGVEASQPGDMQPDEAPQAVAHDDRATPQAPAAGDTPAHGRPQSPRVDTVTGLDETMWASPTAGPPLELNYLPPGAEAILALRPAHLLSRGETPKLLDARTSGAIGRFLSDEVPALVGPLEKVDQLLIGFFDSADGRPRWALVAVFETPVAADELRARWGAVEAKTSEGENYYQHADRAYYLPAAESTAARVVIGPADLIVDEVIPVKGAPPPLRRELEVLAASSDAERDATLLALPSILITGGDLWFAGSAARLLAPVESFLACEGADEIESATREAANTAGARRTVDLAAQGLPKAILASFHLTDENLFAELRVYVEVERPAQLVAREYRECVARLPKQISEYVRGLALRDYSRDVLWDFPLMVEQLERHTTAGTDGHQAVLRAYLPSIAAHNLALATHLALLEPPRSAVAGGGRPAATPSGATAAAVPEPIARKLDRKMSLVFERAPLEKALQMVGEEIDAPVVILGSDLQIEGITKNQSFAMEERELPAREILRKIMMKANPDGKLIYVIKPSAEGGAETLFVTTRAAAKQRGDALPPEFAEQP